MLYNSSIQLRQYMHFLYFRLARPIVRHSVVRTHNPFVGPFVGNPISFKQAARDTS